MGRNGRSSSLKRRLSDVLQRAPWMVSMGLRLLRWTRARFTAGVVGVVLNEQGEVLLVEHVFHAPDRWGLPGGWMERHELPDEALKRELYEELGLRVAVLEPILIDRGRYKAHLDIAYRCRAENEVQRLSSELLEYRWTPLNALPPMPPFHRAAVRAACNQRVSEGKSL